MVVCLDLEMFYTVFYVVLKILGMLCLHDAKCGWSTEQFVHHLNVSRHADTGRQIDRDLYISQRKKTIGLSIKTKK